MALVSGGLLLASTPAYATGNGGGHTPVVVCHNVTHNPHIIVVDDDSTKLQGHLKHRTQEQLMDLVEGYDGTAAEIRAKCVKVVETTEPPVTVTTTKPGPTVTVTETGPTSTETVTGPPVTVTETVNPTVTTTETGPAVTVTETVTPTETTTITGEPTTVTETLTPTVTVTNTAPAVTVTEDVPGPTVTESNVLPETTVTKNVKGDVVTKFVNKDNRVVAIERTPTTLAYTGVNLLYLAGGIILVLMGVVVLMGRKISVLRS